MDRPFIFKVLLTSVFILILPPFVWAGTSLTPALRSSAHMLTDIARLQEQDKKNDKAQEQRPEQQPENPDIREVPKARKQSRPPVVAKPNIKAKPVKVIRPKIKRP